MKKKINKKGDICARCCTGCISQVIYTAARRFIDFYLFIESMSNTHRPLGKCSLLLLGNIPRFFFFFLFYYLILFFYSSGYDDDHHQPLHPSIFTVYLSYYYSMLLLLYRCMEYRYIQVYLLCSILYTFPFSGRHIFTNIQRSSQCIIISCIIYRNQSIRLICRTHIKYNRQILFFSL